MECISTSTETVGPTVPPFQIVGWDPPEHRISVEDRQPIPEEAIHALAFESRAVLVVVSNRRTGDGKVEAQPAQVGDE